MKIRETGERLNQTNRSIVPIYSKLSVYLFLFSRSSFSNLRSRSI